MVTVTALSMVPVGFLLFSSTKSVLKSFVPLEKNNGDLEGLCASGFFPSLGLIFVHCPSGPGLEETQKVSVRSWTRRDVECLDRYLGGVVLQDANFSITF